MLRGLLSLAVLLVPATAAAAPACVVPAGHALVVASSGSDLADGHSAQWSIERVYGSGRVLLKPCSGRNANHCWFAMDVAPGRYFFREVVPGPLNHMRYPVSTPASWFEITGRGVDYLGDWAIERTDARTRVKLQVRFDAKALDAIRALCRLGDRPVSLSRIGEVPQDAVD